MDVILATFGKVLLLYFTVRFAIYCVNIFIRITRGGMFCFALPAFLPLLGQSSFVDAIDSAGSQVVIDLGTVVPLALAVSVVSFGLLVTWRLFKNLAGYRSLNDSGPIVTGKDGTQRLDTTYNYGGRSPLYRQHKRQGRFVRY